MARTVAIRVGTPPPGSAIARTFTDLVGASDAVGQSVVTGANFPDASNTGYNGTLTAAGSSGVTSGTNWSYDAAFGFVRITGPVSWTGMRFDCDIFSSNAWYAITASNCHFPGNDAGTRILMAGPGSTIIDCEIGGGANGTTFLRDYGIDTPDNAASTITVERCNIHHVLHGLHLNGGNTLRDSYIHDMPQGQPGFPTDHTDGVFISNAGTPIVLDHNTWERCANNSEIFVQAPAGASIGSLSITRNQIIGPAPSGTTWGIGVENKQIVDPAQIAITDNVFDRGWNAGPIEAPAGSTVTGNTYIDNGAPVPVAFV